MGRNCYQSKNDSFLPLALPHPFFYSLKFALKEKHKLVNNRDLNLQLDLYTQAHCETLELTQSQLF